MSVIQGLLLQESLTSVREVQAGGDTGAFVKVPGLANPQPPKNYRRTGGERVEDLPGTPWLSFNLEVFPG